MSLEIKSHLTSGIDNAINLTRVAPIAHLVAFPYLLLTVAWGKYTIDRFSEGQYYEGLAATIVGAHISATIVLPERPALTLLSKYEKVKKGLKKFGWDERIINPMAGAWCTRHVARIAAIDAGFGNEVSDYYSEKGYGWLSFFKR